MLVLAASRALGVAAIRANLARVASGNRENLAEMLRLLEDARRSILSRLASGGTEFQMQQARLMLSEVDRSLREFAQRAAPALSRRFREVLSEGDETLLRLAREAVPPADASRLSPGVDPVLLDFASQNSAHLITRISEETRNEVNLALNRSAVGSSTPADVAAELNRILSPTGKAAHLIDATHRTETNRLYTHAQKARIDRIERESGIVTRKRWLSALGPRTRPTHAALNGATIPNDEHFNVGAGGAAAKVSYEEAGRRGLEQGVAAMGPHDAVLPAREVVNCRCALSAVFEEVRA